MDKRNLDETWDHCLRCPKSTFFLSFIRSEEQSEEHERQRKQLEWERKLSALNDTALTLNEQWKNNVEKCDSFLKKALNDVSSMFDAMKVRTKFVEKEIQKVREEINNLHTNIRTDQDASAEAIRLHINHCQWLLSQDTSEYTLQYTYSNFQTNFTQQEDKRLSEYEKKVKGLTKKLVKILSEAKEAYEKMNAHKISVINQEMQTIRSHHLRANASINEIQSKINLIPGDNEEIREQAENYFIGKINELKNDEHFAQHDEHFAQLDVKNNEGNFAENDKLQQDFVFAQQKTKLIEGKKFADELSKMMDEIRAHINQLKVFL